MAVEPSNMVGGPEAVVGSSVTSHHSRMTSSSASPFFFVQLTMMDGHSMSGAASTTMREMQNDRKKRQRRRKRTPQKALLSLSTYPVVVSLLLLGCVSHARGWTTSSATRPLAFSYCPSPRTLVLSTRLSASSSSSDARGDSRGAALLVENVDVYRGPAKILSDISWRVEPKTKWALLGANGAGKSTLLQAITDQILYDGSISIGGGKGSRMGYLRQTAVAPADGNRTVFEEAASGMVQLQRARQRIQQLEDQLEHDDLDDRTAVLQALEQAISDMEAQGGYQQEQKVASVLKGLGFSTSNSTAESQSMCTLCNCLSGGWQMRVAFAKLLLSEPTVCFLDEPGNHLDAAAKSWLQNYLQQYDGDGTMILVTHDVNLLQSMDHIAELVPSGSSGSTLNVYKSCTYDQYLLLKQERAEAAQAEYERNIQKAAKLQAFVNRFGASATKASAAQSRNKQLEKMRQQGLLDAPAENVVAQRFRPTMNLPEPPRAINHVLLALKDAQVGYESSAAPLVTGIDLEIAKGMKLLIRGPNGAGKSTVLHALRGKLPLLSGERKINPSLRLGMFTQDLAQELDPTQTAVDVVAKYAREGSGDINVSDQDARTAMGLLGLSGDKTLCRIGDLSGGEKARVALAMFSLKPSNVYLLDEASNHLDIECVEALSTALSEWGSETGALVVVSHDRAFCEKIEFTHVVSIANGRLTSEARNARPSDWTFSSMSEATDGNDVSADDSTGAALTAQPSSDDPKMRKKLYNAPKRIAKLEGLIEDMEDRIAAIGKEMMAHGSDVGKLVDLTKRRDELESQAAAYYEEWEELEALLDDATVV